MYVYKNNISYENTLKVFLGNFYENINLYKNCAL